MEAAEAQITLDQLAVGSRLVVRSRVDWRFAAIASIGDRRVVLTVCSPTGRTYRLWRDLDTQVRLEGTVPVVCYESDDSWKENFTVYDRRW